MASVFQLESQVPSSCFKLPSNSSCSCHNLSLTWFQNCLFSHFSLSSDAAKIICAGVDTLRAQEMKSVLRHCRNSGKPGKQYMDSAAVALTTFQAPPSAASS